MQKILNKGFASLLVLLFILVAIPVSIFTLSKNTNFINFAAKPQRSPAATGMNITQNTVFWSGLVGRFCLGEDNGLDWSAAGSLGPGETWTYTPPFPDCNNNPRFDSINLDWSGTGAKLQISTVNPGYNHLTQDKSEQGKTVTSVLNGTNSSLCLFDGYSTDVTYKSGTAWPWGEMKPYTYTVTNTGSETATNVHAVGRSFMSWGEEFYSQCMNADADRDGWNDSTEASMYEYSLDPVTHLPVGTDYLLAQSSDLVKQVYPPDLNADGTIDQKDVDLMQSYMGQGNGWPIMKESNRDPNVLRQSRYSPAEWRRFDLNMDGWVNGSDLEIVQKLIGTSVPYNVDNINPWASVMGVEGSTITNIASKGSTVYLGVDAWDNAQISKVEIYLNGSLKATVTMPSDMRYQSFNYPIGLFHTTWKVPQKSGVYDLSAKVFDSSGNYSLSPVYKINVQ